jgi:hypothetical protein
VRGVGFLGAQKSCGAEKNQAGQPAKKIVMLLHWIPPGANLNLSAGRMQC